MSISKGSKMLQFINWSMRVTLDDTRTLVGRFLAFDKHMNLVLAECEEFRTTKKASLQKRALGLVLLRGECVVSIAVEAPPPPKPKPKPKLPKAPLGTGIPAGRGGPPPGLGRGAPTTMYGQPQMYRAPPPGMPMGRGPVPGWMGRGYGGYGGGRGYGPPPPVYGRGSPPGFRGTQLPAGGRGMPPPVPPMAQGVQGSPAAPGGRGSQPPGPT
eukprot:Plantae.Rhodophyta-Hildenbrandia_rubra.ctg8999.p1 GENE.Plantae.Rhodophyta-Hildenbrandia_rubra.ctg8999~~Plantae.Rhodophyta-Hildenbrandia_rubra.ctg8999.p1  ORF type:complete len:213 (+),score=38.02 Plantae.Rhodophyta-Hildenbrandia_rubra.ctg8999:221-859(+)